MIHYKLAWGNPIVRREVIYLHRSFRSAPIDLGRLAAALGTAAVGSVLVAAIRAPLLDAHGEICRFLLELARIPISGVERLEVFPGFGPAAAPVTPVLQYEPNPVRAMVMFTLAVLALLGIHRRVALARNFVVFLVTLLVTAAGVIAINPSFRFNSTEFTQIWLRGEVLMWLLLPWVSAFLFVLIQPSVLRGGAWALVVQIFGFLWSATRLAFCLGVLHYTGILFLPLLWFCLGLLADLLYLFVFYSLAIHQTCGRTWGQRSSWQY